MDKITLGSVTKDFAQELIRAADGHCKVLGKVLTACLSNGQTDAAGAVKANIDSLQKFIAETGEKVQKQN